MTKRQRGTLAQKLYLLSGALMAGMALMAAAIWVLMQEVSDHAAAIRENRSPQLERVSDIELNVVRTSLQLRHAILARTAEERGVALADVQDKKRFLEARLAEFGRGMTTDAGRRAFAPMPALMAAFWDAGARNVALIEAGRKDEAFAFLVDTTVPARNALLAPLNAERKEQTRLLNEALEATGSEARTVRNTALGAALLLSVGLLGWWPTCCGCCGSSAVSRKT